MSNYPEGITDAALERRFGGGYDRVAEGRWEFLLCEVAGELGFDGRTHAEDLFRDELFDDACIAVIRMAAQHLLATKKVGTNEIGLVAVRMIREALSREHARRMESVCIEDELVRDCRHD